MNAEALLAHFAKIAEAPDAVARLRRFVLDLAVRGKLVPQDSSEEPASEFDRPLALPFDLPANWRWSRLNALGRLKGGGTPSKARDDFWNGDIPWVSPKDMKVDHIDAAQLSITREAIEKSAVNLLPAGVVLFVVRGMILAHSFPVAVTRVPVTVNQDMKALVLKKPEMAEYLLRALKGLAPQMLARVQRSTHGTCRLEGSDYADFLVPVPPLAEQRRIVAKVDELMALCDRLEAARTAREATRDRLTAASLARLNTPDPETFPSDARFALDALPALSTRPEQIKQLRQTILNLAVRGKLVPQDPQDEPATELLNRIHEERGGPYSAASSGSMVPFDAPASWSWTVLGTLVLASDAGWSPKTADHPRRDGAWGVLKVSAVSWGQFRPEENKEVLPGTQPRLQAQIAHGDFLISRANTAELIARAVIVDAAPVCLMMSDKIVRLRLSRHCDPRFVWVVNNHADFARQHYATRASGVSASMKNVSRDVILGLPFPLPPLAEQHRIVARVNELMVLCDALEKSLAVAATTRTHLLDATLAEALARSMAAASDIAV